MAIGRLQKPSGILFQIVNVNSEKPKPKNNIESFNFPFQLFAIPVVKTEVIACPSTSASVPLSSVARSVNTVPRTVRRRR